MTRRSLTTTASWAKGRVGVAEAVSSPKADVRREVVVDQRGIGVKSGFQCPGGRQRLKVDLDRSSRVLRRIGLVCDDNRDRLAQVVDLTIGKDRTAESRQLRREEVVVDIASSFREVVDREHREHAWHGSGRLRPDRMDKRMGKVRPADGEICLPGQMDIARVAAAARDQPFVLDAPPALPDSRTRRVFHVPEDKGRAAPGWAGAEYRGERVKGSGCRTST